MAFWKRWREPVDLAPRMDETLQLTSLLWVGVGGFSFLVHGAAGRAIGVADIFNIVANALSGLLIAVVMGHVFVAARGWPRWIVAWWAVGVIVAAALAQAVADYLLARVILKIDAPLDLTMVAMASLIYLLVYGVNLAFIWITTAGRALRDQAVRIAQAEAQTLRAELAALRLKLNPHFMFNALAAAGGLAGAGRLAETEAMLEKLSSFLRASFDVGVDDIPLLDEVSIVGDYLEVERVRFPDRLKVCVDLPPETEDVLIPSLLIQPLVENAVKYGVAPSPIPVTVAVSARILGERLLLTVEDDGSATTTALTKGSGVGLSATRARLQMRYGDAVRFEAGPTGAGYRVEIELPIDRQAASTPAIKFDTASFNRP